MARNTHTGLGKGLGALLKNIETENKEKIEQINVTAIKANPFQPRSNFDETTIVELAQSIEKYGILQPILVKKIVDGYQLISGERRWRACKKAKMSVIPAIVRDCSDKEIAQIALIENLQREDLNAMEEAAAYARLLSETNLTQNELAQYVGKSRSHIANFLRLLHLAKSIQELIIDGSLNMGQAKPLIAIDDEKLQEKTALYIIANDLSARKAENIVKKILQDPAYLDVKRKHIHFSDDIYMADVEEKLTLLLGTKVNIKKGNKKSKIEIEFTSTEDLDRIIEAVMNKTDKKETGEREFFV
ncbi:ParB/RepB/Spo0J family partition protein [Pectinatus cerevisiiphilus]|uniref:ParB family chromosome partitioning protein n=1 Tax=Pectinatus cerevisiiphilus TaxID=86956 RepID=A0A4R3KGR8_9FIRM|nr:ParB/RepB/Spo0J family partition protein [Pectinatus cerevisiiphilus]TCS81861.1 ParB family chromosome partitioning protein [Pectinatus cerevisiiphilus]